MADIQTQIVDSKAISSLEYAKSIAITNNTECETAIEYEKGLSALIKEIDATFDPHISAAFNAHRSLVAEKKKHAEPVEEAKRLIKSKRIIYVDEQERIRKELEAKLQAEARKQAEEAQLRDAIIAEAEGRALDAKAILNEATLCPVVSIANSTPKSGVGGAIREIWSAEVFNLHELVMAICEGKASIGLIEPNQTALNQLARALHKNMNVPGVRANSQKV